VEDLLRSRLCRWWVSRATSLALRNLGSESEIAEFCELNYGVSFPMFSKVDVNGDKAHPLFVQLKEEGAWFAWQQGYQWNFTKFLVDADGKVVKRYAPTTSPAT